MGTAHAPFAPHSSLVTARRSALKIVLSWIGVTLLAFPIAGLLGWTVGGHVDAVVPALVGGTITGAGIGLGQWLLLRRDLDMSPLWIAATAVGLAVGLTIGAAVVGYATDLGSLAVMGAISGAAVGLGQGVLLRERFSLWLVWMVGMPAMWAVGWSVTTLGGISVDNQFTVFGAYGAIVFGALCGGLMLAGRRTDDAGA